MPIIEPNEQAKTASFIFCEYTYIKIRFGGSGNLLREGCTCTSATLYFVATHKIIFCQ